MPFDIRAFTNCDDATIVWRPDTFVPGCRGFALMRETRAQDGTVGAETPIDTWMGFENEKWKDGDHKPSTQWPVQRYIWTDYEARSFYEVRYRVIPVVKVGNALKPDATKASAQTPWCRVATNQTPGFEAYFNRGIVPAQWMARTLQNAPDGESPTVYLKDLLTNVKSDGVSKTRVFLGGALRTEMLALLAEVKAKGYKVYAALYELNDPELIPAMEAVGKKFSLILASGAYKAANKKKGTPAEPDENEAVRKQLEKNKKINIYDRIVGSPHFAHHKFMAICDANDKPLMVWTGSTNTTITGLCTQVNNGVLIRSPEIAACYKNQWDLLKKAGDQYPTWLLADDTTPTRQTITTPNGKVDVTAWQAPTNGLVDLNDAKRLIRGARQGVLFLMFNPGPNNTLLNEIIGLDADKLFIHGVANQDPGGNKKPVLALVDRGTPLHPNPEVVLRAEIDGAIEPLLKEARYNSVMIHSKVVVIDPFGAHPVVMTGSHNLGPKASGQNDDNLVIIENAPGLAAEYAVNIMGVYGHYKWRYNQSLNKNGAGGKAAKPAAAGKAAKPAAGAGKAWHGMYDDDQWQHNYMAGDRLREIDFWFGKDTTPIPDMTVHGPAGGTAAGTALADSGIAAGALTPTPAAKRKRRLDATRKLFSKSVNGAKKAPGKPRKPR